MRVVVNALSVSEGGGASVALGLVPALARLGPDDAWHVLVRDDALERRGTWPGNVAFEVVPGMVSNLARTRWEQQTLARRLRSGEHDVHLNLAGFGVLRRGLAQVLLVRNAYFFVDEAWMPWKSRVRLRVQRFFQVAAWRKGAVAVCVSDTMKSFLEAYRRSGAGPTPVVPHGLDRRFLEAPPGEAGPEDTLRLLWIGNARPHKQLPLFLDALPRVAAAVGRRVEARIVGGFPVDVVERAAAVQGDAVHVAFPGYADVDRLVAHYRWADLYVSTSRLESFDNCVAEAQAVGTPIVASDIPVHVEYGGDAAALYPTGDGDALVSTLVRVAGDGALRAEMQRRGRALVEGRSWERIASRYTEILADAVAGREAQ